MPGSPDDTSAPAVLLVDDDPLIRTSLQRLLTLHGFRVLLARDGQDALRILQSERLPAVIVTDLSMPLMDGWTLLSELKRDARLAAIPTVALSGSLDEEALRRATEVLPKPCDPDQFLGMMRALAGVPSRAPQHAGRPVAEPPSWWAAP